jgi:large subunit ribosomal protein L22
MESKAITRYLRIAPQKMRLVVNAIRYKPVTEAFGILASFHRKGARLIEKTLKSAEANAKFKKMDENRLYVREIRADGGPTFKRIMSRAQGRADVILKRTTHLSIVLGERTMPVARATKELDEGKGRASKPIGKSKKEKQLAGARS